MAAYTAYSDEAGVGDPSGEFLVGGYVAPDSLWFEVSKAWQERVLDGPPKIPYLHMTDVRSRAWRDENKISYNDAENRVAEAVKVLFSTGGLDAVASVMKRADLQELFHKPHKNKKSIPAGFDEPDYVCYYVFITIMLLRIHKLHPDANQVNFVVSKNGKITRGVRNIAEVTRQHLAQDCPELAVLFGSVIPGDMETALPLQAADALCWHLQHYYRGEFKRTEENRMWYLLKERDGDLQVWTRDQLRAVADEIAALPHVRSI